MQSLLVGLPAAYVFTYHFSNYLFRVGTNSCSAMGFGIEPSFLRSHQCIVTGKTKTFAILSVGGGGGGGGGGGDAYNKSLAADRKS